MRRGLGVGVGERHLGHHEKHRSGGETAGGAHDPRGQVLVEQKVLAELAARVQMVPRDDLAQRGQGQGGGSVPRRDPHPTRLPAHIDLRLAAQILLHLPR